MNPDNGIIPDLNNSKVKSITIGYQLSVWERILLVDQLSHR